MARELRSENGYAEVYLVESTDAEIAASGVRLVNLLADPAPRGRVSREFFTERWSLFPLHALIYDDQNGVFAWIHHMPEYQSEGVMSDGCLVGTDGITLSVDYPQKGFTHEQLVTLSRKDPGDLSDAEWKAVGEYLDGLRIGAAHYGFAVTREMLFALLHRKTGHALIANTSRPLPETAGTVIDFYVEPYLFKSYGLPERAPY